MQLRNLEISKLTELNAERLSINSINVDENYKNFL